MKQLNELNRAIRDMMGLTEDDPFPTTEKLDAFLLPFVNRPLPGGYILQMTRDENGVALYKAVETSLN